YHHLFSERAIMIVLLRLQPTYSTGTQPLQGYVRYKGIISGTDGRLAITQSPTARCVASGPSACTRTTAPIPGTIGGSIRYSRSPLKTSFAECGTAAATTSTRISPVPKEGSEVCSIMVFQIPLK